MSAARLTELSRHTSHRDEVTSLAIIDVQNRETLNSASRDRTVQVRVHGDEGRFDKIFKEIAKHNHYVNGIAPVKSGKFIVTASSDRFGRIIDLETKRQILLRGHTVDLFTVAISASESKIVTGSADGSLSLWNTEGELIWKLAIGSWVTCASFLSEDEVIIGCDDGAVRIIDIAAREVKFLFMAGEKIESAIRDDDFSITALTLSVKGIFCAYGGRNGKIFVMNMADGEKVQIFDAESDVNCLAFGINEAIVAAGTEKTIFIWDVMSGELVGGIELTEKCTSLVWSANNNLIAGFKGGNVVVYEFCRIQQ